MVSGIIVAAGKGVRMNLTVRKQYLAIAGQPILCHTLRAMVRCRLIEHITLVVPEDDFNFCRVSSCNSQRTNQYGYTDPR